MRFFLVLSTLLMFFPCFSQRNFLQERIPGAIQALCDSIAVDELVLAEQVGSIAMLPEKWEQFERLEQSAHDTTLYELTNHPQAVVRAYAFWALIHKKSIFLVPAFRKNEQDTSRISFQSGCIISHHFLIDWAARLAYDDLKEDQDTSPADLIYLKGLVEQADKRFREQLNAEREKHRQLKQKKSAG